MSGGVLSTSSLEHAVAGSAGTILATLLLFPLERVKTLLQVYGEGPAEVVARVLQEEGPRGLYRGCGPMWQTAGVSQFLYFFLFEAFKDKLAKLKGNQVGPYGTLFASAFAGSLNMVMTEPLWRSCVVAQARRTRSFDQLRQAKDTSMRPTRSTLLKLEAGPGVFGTVCRTWATEGPGALWRGLGSSLWLVSNPVIQFFVYDLLKAAREPSEHIKTAEAFLMGAFAKAVATIATFPLQVAQSKLRAFRDKKHGQAGRLPPELNGMIPCLRHAYAEGGVTGLYRGLWPKLVQTVTQAAFMFALYEKILWFIRRGSRKVLRGRPDHTLAPLAR